MDMNTKLAEISEIMADGFHFLQMRSLVNAMQGNVASGDVDAQKILDIISQFHRLCIIAKRGPTC